MTKKKYIDYTKYNKSNEYSGEISEYDFETIRGYKGGYYTKKAVKSMHVARDIVKIAARGYRLDDEF